MIDISVGSLARNNVTITGRGQTTLLFAHGFGCDQTVWRSIVPEFEQNYRVVVFDHAGAGKSAREAYDSHRHSSLMGYAEDVVALCEELASQRLVFIGHSVSGMIGALAAIRRPELFDQLVMIGPSACYANDGEYRGGFDLKVLEEFLELLETNFQGWGTALAMMAMGNRDSPELAAALSERICESDPAIAGAFARVTFFSDLRADLPRLAVPTSVLQCRDDPIAPDTATGFVHEAIEGSILVQIDATGHCPHLSHPSELVQSLHQALNEQS